MTLGKHHVLKGVLKGHGFLRRLLGQDVASVGLVSVYLSTDTSERTQSFRVLLVIVPASCLLLWRILLI